jgi:hypothetical protein
MMGISELEAMLNVLHAALHPAKPVFSSVVCGKAFLNSLFPFKLRAPPVAACWFTIGHLAAAMAVRLPLLAGALLPALLDGVILQ